MGPAQFIALPFISASICMRDTAFRGNTHAGRALRSTGQACSPAAVKEIAAVQALRGIQSAHLGTQLPTAAGIPVTEAAKRKAGIDVTRRAREQAKVAIALKGASAKVSNTASRQFNNLCSDMRKRAPGSASKPTNTQRPACPPCRPLLVLWPALS